MKRFAILGACALSLQACALPVPLKIASWALDGISYLTTHKSLTDHGISIVANEDCALLRGLEGEAICRQNDGSNGTAVAALKDKKAAKGKTIAKDLEVAKAAPSTATDATDKPTATANKAAASKAVSASTGAPSAAAATAAVAASFVTAAGGSTEPTTAEPKAPMAKAAETEAAPEKASEAAPQPWDELYYVVASFRDIERANTVLNRYPHLELQILTGYLDGANVYRVAAGPFQSGNGRVLKREIRDAGLRNIWAVRMPSTRWSVARRPASERQVVASAD